MTTYIDDCKNAGMKNYSSLVSFEKMFALDGKKNLYSSFLNQMNKNEYNNLINESRRINNEGNQFGWRDRFGAVTVGGVLAGMPAFSFYVFSPISATLWTGSSFLAGVLGVRETVRNRHIANEVDLLAPGRVQRLELKIHSIQRRINMIKTFCFWNIFFSYDKELEELRTAKTFFNAVYSHEMRHLRVNHHIARN